ncbi:MAG TPA: tetratricopeptide repeat protein [Bryocella sp.]|nr:tetratricopeptide repeat protein [Bryocella sp.]
MSSIDLNPVQRHDAPVAATRTSSLRASIVLSMVLAAAVVAVYYPVHRQPFANYDDPDYVTDNVHVRAGLTWTTIRWAMTARDAANWHPVTWLSHALDTQLFGITPAGPHDVNVALHIINALLLFWILQRATGYIGRSWMVAALFALHPINVESVAWIAERKNLLSMFFFLLALAAYRRYATTLVEKDNSRRRQKRRYLLVLGLFALALMSKPQVITFPFVLLLWDFWPLERIAFRTSPFALRQNGSGQISGEKRTANGEERFSGEWRQLLLEKLPLLGLCLISAVFTLNAQAAGGATSGYSFAMRLENAIVSYARYLGKAFWPSHLALFYPYPLKPYPLAEVAAAAIVLLVITAAVVLQRRRRYLIVGWLWFLGTLVPMIGVVQVGTQAMADRYAYLPFVGLFLMICWLAADWAGELRIPATLVRCASVVVLAALAIVSHRQVGFWNDHITLWTHALEVTHNNWVAENNLGTALLKSARVEEAIPHFRAAVALYPADPNSNLNIGTYEQMHGNLPAAIERYKAAAGYARNPKTKARAYNNLGYAYKGIGDLTNARDSFQHAVEADPNYSGAWISLGVVAQRMGDLPLAVKAYSQATQIYPSDFGYVLLAGALEQQGDKAQADAAREKGEHVSRNFGAAQRYANELLYH